MKPWPTKLLGEVADVFNGKTPAKTEQRTSGHPVLKIRDVDEDGTFRGRHGSFVDPVFAAANAKKKVCAADVLILNAAHNADYVASKVFFAGEEAKGTLATGEWTIIRARPASLNPGFVHYWVRSQIGRISIKSLVRGIHLYPSDMASIRLSVPPLAEQERIVKLLDEAGESRKLRAQADRRTTALMPALFHGMFGDPFSRPKAWPVARVDEAGRVQLGRQRAPKYQTGKFTRPYVRVANVYEDQIDVSDLLSMDFDERDFAQYRLEHGDILLNEGQSTELVGRPAMWRNEVLDCCFQNTLVRFQADKARVLPDFALAVFLAYFREGQFANISSKTSNVAHLGAGRFAKMPFPLPPLSAQKEFAARVSEIRAVQAEQAATA